MKKRPSRGAPTPPKQPHARADHPDTPASKSFRRPRGDAAEALLRRLIAEPEFLSRACPQSEESVAKELMFPKPALREAAIKFIGNGWLVRTEKGISRAPINLVNLIELFALRLLIERTALHKVMGRSPDERQDTSQLLKTIVDRQDQLTRELSSLVDADKRIDWFLCSVELHVSIVREARQHASARFLEMILWQIRICAGFPLEDDMTRRTAVEENRRIVRTIGEAHWNEDLEAVMLQQHIEEPWRRACKAIGVRQEEGIPDPNWQRVLEYFLAKPGQQCFGIRTNNE